MAAFAFGLLTIWVNAGDAAALKLASPLYCAVMEWVPAGSDEIVRLADPATKGTSLEMGVAPSKKATLPVAEAGATLAVKVRESPPGQDSSPP